MLQLNDLKTRIAMNAKTSVFVTCIEVIIYLLLQNLHDCAFNRRQILIRNFKNHWKLSIKTSHVLV